MPFFFFFFFYSLRKHADVDLKKINWLWNGKWEACNIIAAIIRNSIIAYLLQMGKDCNLPETITYSSLLYNLIMLM